MAHIDALKRFWGVDHRGQPFRMKPVNNAVEGSKNSGTCFKTRVNRGSSLGVKKWTDLQEAWRQYLVRNTEINGRSRIISLYNEMGHVAK